MKYDFERIGKQNVLDTLIKNLKGKADYLQTKVNSVNKKDKLEVLKDIEAMAKDAHKILSEL